MEYDTYTRANKAVDFTYLDLSFLSDPFSAVEIAEVDLFKIISPEGLIFYFEGSGFGYSGDTPTGGTIARILIGQPTLGQPDILWEAKDVALPILDLVNAAKTAPLDDDRAVLAKLFSGNDQMYGSDFADVLYGFDGKDFIFGQKGADRIGGGLGKDILEGSRGDDLFFFVEPVGGKNADSILDFKPNKELIGLDRSVFDAVGKKLSKKEFQIGKKADDKKDLVIYDENKGKLYYDDDGKGGDKQALFAKVDAGTGLDHKDFVVGDFLI